MGLQTTPIVLISLCAVILAIGLGALVNIAIGRNNKEPSLPR